MRKKPIPMPIEIVFDHPKMILAAPAVYRAVCTITMAFWRSGEAPDALGDETAPYLAKIPSSHWSLIKTAVNGILHEVLPQLWARRQEIIAKKAAFAKAASQNGKRGRLVLAKIRQEKAMQKTTQINPITDVSVINHHTPTKAARHVDHRAALPPHELAAITAKPDQPKMTLTE